MLEGTGKYIHSAKYFFGIHKALHQIFTNQGSVAWLS